MKNAIYALGKSGVRGLFVLATFVVSLSGQAQTTCCHDPVGSIARAATHLVTAQLTDQQVQTLHAQNFNELAPSLRPLYLHAVAFQVGAIVAAGEAAPGSALAEYLHTAELDQFFDIDALLPADAATIIKAALRELNGTITGPDVSFQRAIRSGAVNGYNFWNGTDWGASWASPSTTGALSEPEA